MLENCENEIIFLADQDDVWDSKKVKTLTHALQHCDLVVCDCRIVDEDLKVIVPSFFEANKSFLKDESKTALDQVVEFLKENPKIYVEIGGHTNNLPADDFCAKLSNDRAKTVAEYIIAAGIPKEQVAWKGYGKTQPVADNSTLAGRKLNQRVELKILKMD